MLIIKQDIICQPFYYYPGTKIAINTTLIIKNHPTTLSISPLYSQSIIILPIQHLIIIILGRTLNPLILGLDKLIPLSPVRVLLLEGTLFVGVPLFKAHEFV